MEEQQPDSTLQPRTPPLSWIAPSYPPGLQPCIQALAQAPQCSPWGGGQGWPEERPPQSPQPGPASAVMVIDILL